MNVADKVAPSEGANHALRSLHEIWVFLLAMGIALMMLGVVTISLSFIPMFATVLVFGLLLLLGAIFLIVTALWGREWRGFFLHLLEGTLYLILGVHMIDNPLESLVSLPFLVAASLLVGGLLRVVLAVVERFDCWGWMCLNGLVSVVLGIGILLQWPLAGLWIIGFFVGIEMFFSGLSWVMLGFAVHFTRRTALLS
jgi:uncharacterized membrane protein HdeD (DUF308 family)